MTGPGELRLDVGDIDRIPITMARSPYHSLLALTMDAVGTTRSTPLGLLAAISGALSAPAARSFAAMCRGPRPVVLDCAAPIAPAADVDVAAQVERLHDSPGDVLLDELRAEFGDRPPVWWQVPRQRPRRWFAALAQGAEQGWSVTQHRWRDAGPLLDRETIRLGVSQVRGASGTMLNSLHPRIRYGGGTITLTGTASHSRHRLGDRRLVLVPMVAGDALFAGVSRPDVVFIGYPLPGARSLARGNPVREQDIDALELVVGEVRASMLRCLDRPMTVGELATALQRAPSTTTYHCDRLVDAGLLVRQRRGQSVLVARSGAGNELVSLMSQRIA